MGRKNHQRRYVARYESDHSHNVGVADSLHSVKRRRLSSNHDDTTRPQSGKQQFTSEANDEDGWQTVPSKSSKRRDKQEKPKSNHGSSYPRLTFGQKLTKSVLIEQLRDLALYVLADGTAPTWVGVDNSKKVGKVVVTMVPGFDRVMMQRARELVKSIRLQMEERHSNTARQGDLRNCSDALGKTDKSVHSDRFSSSATDSPEFTPGVDLADFFDLAGPCSPQWLLDGDDIPVRAPGDSKYHKVHSPLQAMLVVPLSSDKTSPKSHVDKHAKHNATPISQFVHTADELCEAEYPVHPAAFTSVADAALEQSRRESTGQSKAAGWIDSPVTDNKPQTTTTGSAYRSDAQPQGLNVYAVDCEMVLTSDNRSSLARISVVSWPDGKVVMDEYVKPDLPIENYFTQYSGITPQVLEGVTTNLTDIQERLVKILTPSTILLGHSLESDLNALKMTHPFIIDTSMLYPHPRGLPLRSSLKFLANKYLRREIQTGGGDGHDSVEDARAVLDLVKLKCEKGHLFGTTEANGEVIFKRLSRHTLRDGRPTTSAIVEYGSSPERGLGRDATYAIGCQNDVDITTGMLRAINGDKDGKAIPAGGATFVWGRLRALEYARGWVTNASTAASNDKDNKIDGSTSDRVQSRPLQGSDAGSNQTVPLGQEQGRMEEEAEIDRTILLTLRRLTQIRNALPPTTLLMIYNGTSDVRPVVELQAVQAQYRREFKVKKWDELTVRWTDVEEQALRNAVETARQGWGWVGVV